jgi:tetratricopeptide (TPR) repeat protein
VVLLSGETLYFSRKCLAGFERLLGERAFYRNDLEVAWRCYEAALRLGGPRGLLENDLMEVLMFGLDQREVGVKTDMIFDDAEAISRLRRLSARAIRRAPYRAQYWSVASDIFLRESRQNRRRVPLDLSAISEDPLENLTPEDWLGIAGLERAASLEPRNYLYHDLMAEQFLIFGAVEQAAAATRRAILGYPRLEGHAYLNRMDLPAPVMDAAVLGFEEALSQTGLVARASIQIDAGRLLVRHGEVQRAIAFLEGAASAAPDSYDAQFELALALLRLARSEEAIPHFMRAADRLPEEASTYYYLGQAQLQLAERAAAIESLRMARVLGQGHPKYFHELGSALESEGLMPEAERQFTAAAFRNPNDPYAWSELLAFHLRRGNHAAAARDCEKLMALDTADDRLREQCAFVEGGSS